MAKPFKKAKNQLPKYGNGTSIYNTQNPSPAPTQMGTGQSNFQQNAGMYGQLVGAAAGAASNKQNAQYVDGQGDAGGVEKAVGAVFPWMKFATGLRDAGQSMLTRDKAGNITSNGERAANEWLTADHTHIMNAAKKGDAIGIVREATGWGKAGRSISHISGHADKKDGSWGKFNKLVSMPDKKVLTDPNAEYEKEMQKQSELNKLTQGTFRQGGRMHDPNSGTPTGEIELNEVVNFPNGGVQAFDLNSHENATAANQISMENGSMILSDKIKDPLTGKTFAKAASKYDTAKEEKILSNTDASKLSQKSANYNFMVKKSLFNQAFERQEAVKQEKVVKYAAKLGVQLPQMPGTPQDPNQESFKYGGMQTYAYGGQKLYQDGPKKKITPTNPSSNSRTITNTAPLNFNQNPLDMDPNVNYSAYNQFQKYLSQQNMVGNTAMNTNEGRKAYTDQLLNSYNTGEHVKKYPMHAVTANDITSIQKYHNKVDPRVQVDGWVGSETSQLRYPTPKLNEHMSDPNGKYYDATWGDKKYKLPSDKYAVNPNSKAAEWNAKDLELQTNRYGGLQKYALGGYPDNFDDASLGYIPSNKFDAAKMAHAKYNTDLLARNYKNSVKAKEESIYNSNIGQYEKDVEAANNRSQQYVDKGSVGKDSSNWQQKAYPIAIGLANNMGEIYAMGKASKPAEVQQRYDYKPEVLNNTASDREAWRMYKNTADSLKNAGLSGGQLASNLGVNRASLTEQLDTQRINRENINVGMRNDAQVRNIAGRYSVDDINAGNRAAKENLQLKATERMGTNFAQAGKDYKATEQEKQMLPFMKQAFSDPAFLAMYQKYLKQQGVK